MSGLLGMLSGLGQGISTYGASMFDRELDMDRERRLQAIRDKEYKRARQDTLADMQTQMGFQTSERIAGQNFTTSERQGAESFREGLTDREEKLRRDLADLAQKGLKTVEQDSNGNFFAIDGKGNTTRLVDMDGSPYSFSDLAKVQQSTVSAINSGMLDEIQQKDAMSFLNTLNRALGERLGVPGGMSREDALKLLTQDPRFDQ